MAVETHSGAGDQRFAVPDAGPIHRMARGKIIATVQDYVGAFDRLIQGITFKSCGDGLNQRFSIETRERFARGIDLGCPNAAGRMQDLALQVGEIDRVAVRKHEGPDARRCQVHRSGRAQPASTDHQRAGIQQALLTLHAEFGQQNVPRIAQQLRVVHICMRGTAMRAR